MSWAHAGPTAVTSASSLNSPAGVISGAEWANLILEFDVAQDTEWASAWCYLPNDLAAVAELVRLRMQAGGGVMYLTLAERNDEYVEADIMPAAPVPYVLGDPLRIRLTRDVSGLVTVSAAGNPVGSATPSFAVPLTTGMLHFGNTTPGSITTISNVSVVQGDDITAPVVAGAAMGAISDIDAAFSFTLSEEADVYVVVTGNATETAPFVEANAGLTVLGQAAGAVDLLYDGLTPSATDRYLHIIAIDAATNVSAVTSLGPFDMLDPQLRITAISNASPQPGELVTLTLTNANAAGKTLACSAGAIPVVSQDAVSIAFNCPQPLTFGTKTLNFLAALEITLTDGAQSKPVTISIQPEDGWQFAQIGQLTDETSFLGTTGVEVGDWVYVTGNGAMMPALGSFEFGPGISYQVAFRDATDGVWGSIGTVTFDATDTTPAAFSFAPVANANLGETYTATAAITGVDDGVTLTATNFELSNDGGATWGAEVTYVAGQTLARATVAASDSFSTAATQSGSVNGVSSLFTVTTRAPVSPTITTHPLTQSASVGSAVTLTAAGTGVLSWQWFKDDVAIDGATSAALAIPSAALGDTGTYHAVATGEGGTTATTNDALLVVSNDVVPPVITLQGANPMQLAVGQAYSEPGYSATDNADGVIPQDAPGWVVTSDHDPDTAGSYTVTYEIADAAGNVATATRQINVVSTAVARIIFSANSLIR